MKLIHICLLTILSSFNAVAAIPVVDPASIAKTVEEGINRAKEAAANLQQLKEQYEQTIKYAEEQKRRLEGFTDFSNGFDTASSYMKNSLNDIASESHMGLDNLRKKYALSSTDSSAQNRYDAVLQKINFYEQFNKSLQQRAERVQTLQGLFSSAQTPQQKTDLANQLNTEKLTLEMQIKQYDLAERQMEASEAARKESQSVKFFKETLKG
ncbi:TPA: conjugal transfer protein TrbJ [Escherichia coli]|uniref:type IV secretion system protein n=1 Tax=Escherichia TaxID=561 RepID=UPI0017B2D73F|nr:type IV secretion system protein [Escherichia coli]EFA4233966.1 conjugal transfer protein TrbJ [Escherichia coli O40:H32]EEW2065173.1 conjugal transfer protein TrbJ [Escherichia coli]EEW6232495.1 conjugal transfer protein TrbJ [Escherichia coli]EFH8092578.1 conjugal transfer protein TrbJ [Escherichia coli]EFT2743621.1 conjugal transfer protein TrbJ [Escherichia coli]